MARPNFNHEPFNERYETPMSENFKYREDLQSMLQKWNSEYDKLEEIQVAGEGGLKELKQEEHHEIKHTRQSGRQDASGKR
jgi:hypothetical protein